MVACSKFVEGCELPNCDLAALKCPHCDTVFHTHTAALTSVFASHVAELCQENNRASATAIRSMINAVTPNGTDRTLRSSSRHLFAGVDRNHVRLVTAYVLFLDETVAAAMFEMVSTKRQRLYISWHIASLTDFERVLLGKVVRLLRTQAQTELEAAATTASPLTHSLAIPLNNGADTFDATQRQLLYAIAVKAADVIVLGTCAGKQLTPTTLLGRPSLEQDGVTLQMQKAVNAAYVASDEDETEADASYMPKDETSPDRIASPGPMPDPRGCVPCWVRSRDSHKANACPYGNLVREMIKMSKNSRAKKAQPAAGGKKKNSK